MYNAVTGIGRDNVLAAYRKARAENPDPPDGSTYNRGLMRFYQQWTTDNGIANKAGFTDLHYGTRGFGAFWMR